MDAVTFANCQTCGTQHKLGPGFSLPESGGALSVHCGVVSEFICGPCWRARTDRIFAASGPDPYLLAKDARERRREGEAVVAQWDREYPGWRFARTEGRA
jgi:hypothetical protein